MISILKLRLDYFLRTIDLDHAVMTMSSFNVRDLGNVYRVASC